MDLTLITGKIVGLIWSKGLILLCLGAGIYFSAILRFPQVRLLKDMVKLLIGGKSSDKGVSSLQGFAMALGGRVGIGNIAGVATAIFYGGPGAIFWMWIIAFLGAGSAYAESALAQVYKQDIGNSYRGGPSYYIEKGLNNKPFAVILAVVIIIANGFTGPGVQSFNMGDSIKNAFGISPTFTGIFIAALLCIVIFGGVKRVGKFAELVVPFMAGAYIIVALTILAINIKNVPAMFALIFSSAFNLNSAFGAVFGNAVLWGVKRGIYSNEAGQGTGAQAAGAAEVSHPAKQGLVQAFSVYVRHSVCLYRNCNHDTFNWSIQRSKSCRRFPGGKSSWSWCWNCLHTNCSKYFNTRFRSTIYSSIRIFLCLYYIIGICLLC